MPIVCYKTKMNQIPETCLLCTLAECKLPINVDSGEFMNLFTVSRHPECPLIKVRLKKQEEIK